MTNKQKNREYDDASWDKPKKGFTDHPIFYIILIFMILYSIYQLWI